MRFHLWKVFVSHFIAILIAALLFQSSAFAEDTKPISFATQLVRGLGQLHRMRNKAADESTAEQTDIIQMASNCIRNSTSLALELNSQAQQFKDMNLGGRFSNMGPNVAELWNMESGLDNQLVQACKSILSTTDILTEMKIVRGKLAEIGAQMDYLDETLFKVIIPATTYSLISEKPDTKGQMSLLNISQMERGDLIKEIDQEFGDELKVKNPNFVVGSMVILRGWLTNKNFKASDEMQ